MTPTTRTLLRAEGFSCPSCVRKIEKALDALGLQASVVAADVASVRHAAEDANVILTSQEFVEAIGDTYAEVIAIRNHFDQGEITAAVDRALGEH